ncbi:hypothetical protein EV363DRAFT_306397 [Boletus edulis]|nr:hypothetical protein EV363DRAFT_306397 [Boletus edulis]
MCSLQYPADPGLLYLLAVFATSMMVASSFALDGARFRYFGTWDGVKRSSSRGRDLSRPLKLDLGTLSYCKPHKLLGKSFKVTGT